MKCGKVVDVCLLHNTLPGKRNESSKPHNELEKPSRSSEKNTYVWREDRPDDSRIDNSYCEKYRCHQDGRVQHNSIPLENVGRFEVLVHE